MELFLAAYLVSLPTSFAIGYHRETQWPELRVMNGLVWLTAANAVFALVNLVIAVWRLVA